MGVLDLDALGEDERAHLHVRGTTRGDKGSTALLSAGRCGDAAAVVGVGRGDGGGAGGGDCLSGGLLTPLFEEERCFCFCEGRTLLSFCLPPFSTKAMRSPTEMEPAAAAGAFGVSLTLPVG